MRRPDNRLGKSQGIAEGRGRSTFQPTDVQHTRQTQRVGQNRSPDFEDQPMATTKTLALSLLVTASISAQQPTQTTNGSDHPTFVSVAAGSGHFCGVDSDGDINCWGDGRWGQLGNGSVESSDAVPVRVASLQRFRQVVAGATHTCALTTDGYAYCWGSDASGVMGDATVRESCQGVACITRPMPVAIGLRFDSLTAGFEHTCGLWKGRAYCWGRSDAGQLGAVATPRSCHGIACSRRPVLVSDSIAFTSISARGTHTCAIASQSLYCWGDNGYHQLGADPQRGSTVRPERIFADTGFVQVSAGGLYSCAVTTNGVVVCWGTNDNGRMGAADAAVTRAAVAPPTGERFTHVSVGGTHTCALTSTGSAYCWGLNIDRRLGGPSNAQCGNFECSATPVRVALDKALVDVAAGSSRTCALGRDGTIYCWGGLSGSALATGIPK